MPKKSLTFFIFLLFALSLAYAQNWQDIKVKPAPNTIALTFDDGPSPIYTPQILAILKQNNIHATWFVEGQFAKRYPDLIKQIVADGNLVENHTMTHEMLTRVSQATMQKQISDVNQVLKDILGYPPKCFRPPYGKHNAAVDAYVHSLNMAILTWDWNSFDYERPGTNKIVNNVLDNVRNQYVILMHDGGGDRSQTVAALPAIIAGIKARGYGFDTICN